MKNQIGKFKTNFTKQYKHEGAKAGLIILGAVGGVLIAKAVRKYTEDKPSLDAVAQYLNPIMLAGGGFILTSVTDEKSVLKGLGYGLVGAGAFEGIKLIPVAKEFLSGILGETEIPAASAFLTESQEREKLMSGFGLSALPVGNASMQEVSGIKTRLPELEATENNSDISGNLGYNSSYTDDVDRISGIL